MHTVMIVDDEGLSRMNIHLLLSRNLQDIRIVAEPENGPDAIEAYRKYRPDLTIMDIRMSDMSGLETSRQILQDYPTANIIICSAYDNFSLLSQALDIGIKGYILKPVRKEELIQKVKRILDVEVSPVETLLGQKIIEMLISGSITSSPLQEQISRLYGSINQGLFLVCLLEKNPAAQFKTFSFSAKKQSVQAGYVFTGLIENLGCAYFSPSDPRPEWKINVKNSIEESLGEDVPIEYAEVTAENCRNIYPGLVQLVTDPMESELQRQLPYLKSIDALVSDEELQTVSLETLAKKMGITPQYLSANFKDQANIPFVEYITDRRMEYARRLLITGDYSNNELAVRCGYGDQMYFIKLFKKKYGVPPKEYKRMLLKIKNETHEDSAE